MGVSIDMSLFLAWPRKHLAFSVLIGVLPGFQYRSLSLR